MKPQPETMKPLGPNGTMWPYRLGKKVPDMGENRIWEPIKCPYGVVGDRLWVKETFVIESTIGYEGYVSIGIPSDRPTQKIDNDVDGIYHLIPHYKVTEPEPNIVSEGCEDDRTRWSSPLFMPKWAARIWLEKTSNRAPEMVQEISGAECCLEGIGNLGGDNHYEAAEDAYQKFKILWDSLNAKPKRTKHNPYTGAREDCYVGYPWEDIRTEKKLKSGFMEYIVGNPWVWPLDFKRIEKGEQKCVRN